MTTQKYLDDTIEAARQVYRNYLEMFEREQRVQLSVLRGLEQDLGFAPDPENKLRKRPVTAKYEYGYSPRYKRYGY